MIPYVSIIGPGQGATDQDRTDARRVGVLLARRGVVVVTGGLDGVMAAAADGVREAGGTSVGILPGTDRTQGHPTHSVLVATGLGELRNGLVIRAADAVVAIGGSWGTLSELALAVRTGVPLVALRGWDLPSDDIHVAGDADAAVELVYELLGFTR